MQSPRLFVTSSAVLFALALARNGAKGTTEFERPEKAQRWAAENTNSSIVALEGAGQEFNRGAFHGMLGDRRAQGISTIDVNEQRVETPIGSQVVLAIVDPSTSQAYYLRHTVTSISPAIKHAGTSQAQVLKAPVYQPEPTGAARR